MSSDAKLCASSSCRTCRTRRSKCDGRHPLCTTCKESGQVCLGYAETRRPRVISKRKASPESRGVDGNVADDETQIGLQPLHRQQDLIARDEHHKAKDGSVAVDGYDLNDHNIIDLHHHSASTASDNRSRAPNSFLEMGQSSSLSIPYFRYFGPTAIVPGFKVMVVRVKERMRGLISSPPIPGLPSSTGTAASSQATKAANLAAVESAVYDSTKTSPVDPFTEHLVETFFTHLGCNFPFLQKSRFMPLLRQKAVDAILVNAICALAARFSEHPYLKELYSSTTVSDSNASTSTSDYGHVFAHYAKSAVVDSFPCPTLSSIQACLLLAYEGFGTGQDSALWMFLGCAIRMAQDLGLHKLKGTQHANKQPESPGDPRSNTRHIGNTTGSPESQDSPHTTHTSSDNDDYEADCSSTFWTVYMLDRVISSGTGRPVTLRYEDIKLPFPPHAQHAVSGWPLPFPELIRILHLYGRVTDLLNNIQNAEDVLLDTRERLDDVENDLTNSYQKLDPRLMFNVVNFQHYVEAGEGANFVLLHFWFHTLIITLHQPVLFHLYEGAAQELFSNNRELAMSSAKTIADILAFADLIDADSFISNPFTSQPIYVAACAFLMETAAQTGSVTASGTNTPPSGPNGSKRNPGPANVSYAHFSAPRRSEKHSLLASVAKQNYQRCYKALQQMETYWAGTKYILTALDQKAAGVWDPETYTYEEMEIARQQKGRSANSPVEMQPSALETAESLIVDSHSPAKESSSHTSTQLPEFSSTDTDQLWTLSGNTNSRNANLTFLYINPNEKSRRPSLIIDFSRNFEQYASPFGPASHTNIGTSTFHPLPGPAQTHGTSSLFEAEHPPQRPSATTAMLPPAGIQTGLAGTDAQNRSTSIQATSSDENFAQADPKSDFPVGFYSTDTSAHQDFTQPQWQNVLAREPSEVSYTGMVGNMMIESQDIAMIPLGTDFFPWLNYLPQDLLRNYEEMNSAGVTVSGP